VNVALLILNPREMRNVECAALAVETTMQLFKYPFQNHTSGEVLDYLVHLRDYYIRVFRNILCAF